MKHTIVGHVAIDRVINDSGVSLRLGGPPSYACAVSRVLDNELDVITRFGPDFKQEYLDQFKEFGLDIGKWRCSTPTTTFTLDYTRIPRCLGLENICEPISIPDQPILSVILSPIAGELSDEQLSKINTNYLSLDSQGFIRERTPQGKVNLKQWTPENLENIDLLKTSHEEHTYLTGEVNPLLSLIQFSRKGVETSIITLGEKGSLAYMNGSRYLIPVYPTKTVDSTGAGDSFLAAVHDKLFSGEPLEWALAYGSAMASGIVETFGPEFTLSEDEVTRRAEYVLDRIWKKPS